MKLKDLFPGADRRLIGDESTEISGLAYDSRSVRPGDLFFCIAGTQTDGNRFADDAAARGAAAVMTAEPREDFPLPQVVVARDRASMAEASAAFYGYPARKMKMVGVTGTNGKTTTTYMVKHIAEQAGIKTGLIGTIRNMIGGEVFHAERTTPESPDLQRLLYEMERAGCGLVVMEVSSHSLALDRTYGIEFDVGVFTNLTQDHLDFHGSFDEYLRAKTLLFGQSRQGVVNMDDPAWEKVAAACSAPPVTYAIDAEADYRARDICLRPESVSFELRGPDKDMSVEVGIPGYFSVYNATASAVCALRLGISPADVEAALETTPTVDGRFEVLDTKGKGFTLILDYAHTPDSLENVLRTIRGFARGKVHTVFGCGGNRDALKRPLMGRVAEKYSDYLYVTSDNPRFEDPEAILDDIVAGLGKATSFRRIEDRRSAILEAMKSAAPGDVILLAGKGHEDYQEIRGVKRPFDEKVIVAELLEEF